MRAVFTYDYGVENLNKIKNMGFEVIVQNERNIENNEILNETDILVCYNPFDKINLLDMKKLKYIFLSSIGFDQLPYELSKDIIVTNNSGGYSIPIGEYIVLSMLEVYKNSKMKLKNQENKIWKIDTSVLEIYNKNVLFIGTGTIAKEAAKRLKGFEVNIFGINTSGKSTEYIEKCYNISKLKNIIVNMDFVILTIPHTNLTHHLFDYELLNSMKDDSVLINISRGKIIDEKSLILLLKEKKFKGVCLDVFENEPLSEESELWNFENVYISSHNSWVSEMRNIRRFNYIYENFKRIKEKKELLNVVNIERGY